MRRILSLTVEIIKNIISRKTNHEFSYINRLACTRLILDYGGGPGQKIDKDTGNLGFGFIHHSFIRTARPKNVLCIGSKRGFIPAICAMACKENRYGTVDFVDAGYDKDHPMAWGGDGFWKNENPDIHFAKLGLCGWIHTYVMKSVDYAEKFPKKKYDYVYIDGDHSYPGVKLDYDLFWPRLRKGGIILFHDISARGGGLFGFGVWRLWKEIKDKEKISFPLKISGLGILRKI